MAIVLAGVGLEFFCGLGEDWAALFFSGMGLSAFGLYKWSKVRGISPYVAIAALVPLLGPILGLMVAPETAKTAQGTPLAAPIPIPVRLGLWFGGIGIVVSTFLPEAGLAGAAAGLGLALGSLVQEPGRGRIRAAIVAACLLLITALLLSKPPLGPGTLW